MCVCLHIEVLAIITITFLLNNIFIFVCLPQNTKNLLLLDDTFYLILSQVQRALTTSLILQLKIINVFSNETV